MAHEIRMSPGQMNLWHEQVNGWKKPTTLEEIAAGARAREEYEEQLGREAEIPGTQMHAQMREARAQRELFWRGLKERTCRTT